MVPMKLAKNSVKKVTSHILTAKNKMLRKKGKYDPKYSGKPTIVDSVAGNLNFRLRKQLPSLSGIVILLLIGFIAYEQMSKKSRTSVQESEILADLVQEKGKLIEDAPIEVLQDVHAVGRVDHVNNPEQQNPKIKGVNDMKAWKHVMPIIPNGGDERSDIEDAAEPKRMFEEENKRLFPDPRVNFNNDYKNRVVEKEPLAQQMGFGWQPVVDDNNNNHGQRNPVQIPPVDQKPLPFNSEEENKRLFPDPRVNFNNDYKNRVVEKEPLAQQMGFGWQPVVDDNNNNHGQRNPVPFPPVDQKPLPFDSGEKKDLLHNPKYDVLMLDGKKIVHQNDLGQDDKNLINQPFPGGLMPNNNNDNDDDDHFAPVVKKPKVNYPQPKMFPVSILNTPTLECTDPLTLLILVHTEAFHFGTRHAIRETWGVQTKEKYGRFGDKQLWKTIFIIGKPGYEQAEKAIAKEVSLHNDILQGDFIDSEYEDTRKMMLAMSWLNSNIGTCQPKFVLKTTQNIFHNMFSIIDWLGKKFTPSTRNVYMGRLLKEYEPIRDIENPLYVSYRDYQPKLFPPLIEGPVYLFDYNSYRLISARTTQVTPIAMEDGYIGQIAAKIGLRPQHNDHFMLLRVTSNHCHNLRLFFLYDIQPSQQQIIFKENQNARTSDKCKNAQVIEKDGRRVAIEM